MTKPWGWHLILDCAGCDKTKVTDQVFLTAWVKQLVLDVGMVAYGEPQVLHFGHNEPHLAGNTVLQFIETSNIIAHFCDEHGDAYIDVFSCKEFDKDIVIQNIVDNFRPTFIKPRFLERSASL